MGEQTSFEKVCQEMESKGYRKVDHSLSVKYTQKMELVTPLPLLLPIIVSYYLRWGSGLKRFDLLGCAVGVVLSIVLHELLHGIGWSFFCQGGLRQMKFGVNCGLPYCRCKVPLEKKGYLVGILFPMVALGLIFSLWALVVPSFTVFLLAIFNVLAAGGDVLVMWRTKDVRNGYIIDHPELPGFISFEK